MIDCGFMLGFALAGAIVVFCGVMEALWTLRPR